MKEGIATYIEVQDSGASIPACTPNHQYGCAYRMIAPILDHFGVIKGTQQCIHNPPHIGEMTGISYAQRLIEGK